MHRRNKLYAVGSPETRDLLVYQLQAKCLVRKADISGSTEGTVPSLTLGEYVGSG